MGMIQMYVNGITAKRSKPPRSQASREPVSHERIAMTVPTMANGACTRAARLYMGPKKRPANSPPTSRRRSGP